MSTLVHYLWRFLVPAPDLVLVTVGNEIYLPHEGIWIFHDNRKSFFECAGDINRLRF